MDSDDDLEFITRKGGTVLLHTGFQYYKVKQFKNDSVLWRCSAYKNQKCSGNLIIKDNNIIKRKDHSCTPDLARNLIAKEVQKLKEKVSDGTEPIPKLFNEMLSQLKDSTVDMVSDVPSLESCKHSLYDVRNKSLGVQKTVYKNFNEVSVPPKFEDFILADYEYEGSRIILFCSKENRVKISEINEYFADATFYACPLPFSQLYCIHGDVGSGRTTTKTQPLIYALMPDKKKKTYDIVFQLIKSNLPDFKPYKLHCDYEIASIKAVYEAFPEIKLSGCYYHWSKAVWKKADKLKLKSITEKRLTGLTSALPLLPREYLEEGLDYIKSESSHKPKMEKFLKYIDGFWMTNNFPEMLSVFGERHRTNNITESYHSKLKKAFLTEEVTVVRLLTALKKIENVPPIPRRRIKIYVENDDDIQFVQMQLINNEISAGLALEKLR